MLMNKRLIKIGFLFLLLLFSKINVSQNFEKCGTEEILQRNIENLKNIYMETEENLHGKHARSPGISKSQNLRKCGTAKEVVGSLLKKK